MSKPWHYIEFDVSKEFPEEDKTPMYTPCGWGEGEE